MVEPHHCDISIHTKNDSALQSFFGFGMLFSYMYVDARVYYPSLSADMQEKSEVPR